MSSPKNLHNVHSLVKVTVCEKVAKLSKGVISFYVNRKVNIHSSLSLWKTPVEKLVDNVENCELSTGISLLWMKAVKDLKDAYAAV